MRFLIDVRPAGDAWEVQVLDADGAPLPPDPQTGQPVAGLPRQLRRLGVPEQDQLVFPLPPAEEVRRLDQHEPHHALCAAADPEDVATVYRKIIGRSPGPGDVATFGRYLFDTLLGPDLWAALQRVAGQDEPVELALLWRDENTAINRLGWEMLRDRDKFLGEHPRVAITRLVPEADAQADATLKLDAPPRVLFVVGTSLNVDVIRPGAEYLGLLRSLKASDLRLRTRLLLQASVGKIKALMESYRPDIVHFICHGGFSAEDGEPYLELVDEDKPTLSVQVKADNLCRALFEKGAGVRPRVVVLNACYSASTSDDFLRSGQVAAPLAISFVRRGAPVVLAMAGEVADHACRLFTRRFYETLLGGGHLAFAAAEGRRVGIIMYGNDDPKSTVDWALPTLFLSGGLREPQLARSELPAIADLERIAELYATPDTYPVFCGRLHLCWWYNVLMSDSKTQRLTSPDRADFQYLALSVDAADQEGQLADAPRYGRSWLLNELAGQAAREGHVPCLVDKAAARDLTDDWPKTLKEILFAIDAACDRLVRDFGLKKGVPRHLIKLLKLPGDAPLPDGLPEEISSAYKTTLDHPRFLARALQYELTQLLDEVCRQRALARIPTVAGVVASEGELFEKFFAEERKLTKLVLLVDDLHRMGMPAVEGLLDNLLGPDGLRGEGERVRAVLAYASEPAQGQEHSVKHINEWVKRREVKVESLSAFSLIDDRMAYKQFLLNWRTTNNKNGTRNPLTLRATVINPETVELFFEKLHQAAGGGIPSFLAEREAVTEFINKEVLDYWVKRIGGPMDILRVANDDAMLEQYALEQGRGGGRP